MRIGSIPHHHERVPLRAVERVRGWLAGSLTLAGGIVLAASVEHAAAEVAGAVAILAGGLFLAALFRCRSHEITIGTKRTDLAVGPFARVVATGAVESAEIRPATSWRRLYSGDEVVLRVSIGPPEVVLPSRTPNEIVAAFRALNPTL
jgi:hypothetical protein